MERPEDRPALDLDRADAEIQSRWFVWTAAGLTVHPVTLTDDALGLEVSRPDANADIVLHSDGRADVNVRRPGAHTDACETVEVGSIGAFGELLDRVVELITWSGISPDRRPDGPGLAPGPQRAPDWVLGFDGLRLAGEDGPGRLSHLVDDVG